MTRGDAPQGKPLSLKSNQFILLNDPGKVWYVEKGVMEILNTRFQKGAPSGGRRHLFHLTAKNAIFGCEPAELNDLQGWIGISAKDSVLREIGLNDFIETLVTDDKECRILLQGWMSTLGHYMNRDYNPPSSLLRISETGEYEFGKEETIAAPPNEFLLVRLLSGRLSLFGFEEYTFDTEGWMLVISGGMWLKVISDSVKISARSMWDPMDLNEFINGFSGLHLIFSHFLHRLSREDEEAEIERRKTSKGQVRMVSDSVMNELTSILNPKEYFPLRESYLLTALSVIGKTLGLKIKSPPLSEDMSRISDPVEAIARASKVRVRKIALGPDWWKRDSGPLLCYLGKERRPVALLPVSQNYYMADPAERRRRLLNKEIRDQLHQDAYMIYRPMEDNLNSLKGLLRFISQGKIGDMLFIFLMGILATLLGMLVPKVTGSLVDTAIPFANKGYVYQLAMVLAASGVASALFTYAQVMTTVRATISTEISAQSALWDRLLRFSPSFFRRFSSGDLETRVNAASEISRKLGAATFRPLISGVLALLNFLLLWYYSWELAKIALWVSLILLGIISVIGYFVRQLSKSAYDVEGKYNSLVIQMIGGVGKIRVSGSEQRAFNFWLLKYTQKLRLAFRIQRYRDVINITNKIILPLCSAILFWKATKLTLGASATISIGDFIAFNTAFTLFITGWTDLSSAFVEVLDATGQGDRIRPILLERPEVKEEASDPGRLKGAIKIEGISFRYTPKGPYILDEVSIEAEPGEFIAVVGPSGSGKSTLLRIMLGFETPDYGRILYDGQDLSSLDILAVRRQVGTVLQQGRLNAGNIIDNISNNARLTHAEIWDAISDSGLTADVEKMPMGLYTMVSEGGSNFSGGQRQRLLIARALAIRPKIVMFDEATSALDNKTQAIVSKALFRRKVTRIVIAHRLSTIREADRIYVMDCGRIVQQGSFNDLSEHEGIFKELMSRQRI